MYVNLNGKICELSEANENSTCTILPALQLSKLSSVRMGGGGTGNQRGRVYLRRPAYGTGKTQLTNQVTKCRVRLRD